MELKTKITEIHYNKDARGVLFSLLKFLSFFYGAGSRLKNFLYDNGILKPEKVNACVISVGNLTTGGVGKTPVAAEIVKYLIQKGKKPAIVSRGYGGKLSNKKINVISDGEKIFHNASDAGDEPYWLAVNTNAVVITTKNRAKGAEYAAKVFGATHIILDDGFQHRKLYRDRDIVLVDSKLIFGNEKLLPAGPLRESKEAFKRIDNLLIVSKDIEHRHAEKLSKIFSAKLNIKTSICRIEPDCVYNIKTGEKLPHGMEITAICAIGQPEKFFEFLKNYKMKEKTTFDDHHKYTKEDIANITGAIVTTEKDAVKLKKFDNDNIFALKLKTVVDVKDLLNE